MKKIINLGIVAHVDAGKTSLTEKLYSKTHTLYEAGSIKKANTVTDTLELEKERGITIKSASVTLTDAEFFSPVSTPSEFRQLTPYALYKALLNAGTFIVEPILEISLITDKQYLGKAISELSKLEANILQLNETNSEVEVKARLAQSDYLIFEEKLNDLFKGQAYLKEKVIDYQKVQNQELYQQGTVDRIKSLLIKEN